MSETQFDMKDKIAKLLAKAEATDNDHERDTFMAKAESLMLRLGIDAAELEAAGEVKPEEIVHDHRDWRGNYSITMVPAVYRVLRAYGHLEMYRMDFSAMHRRTVIIGHKSDVEAFLMLIDSLALQSQSALRRWQKEHREERRWLTDMEKYNQHRDFLEGFFVAVAKRIRVEKITEEATASPGAALVLVSKEEKVKDFMKQNHGDLTPSRAGRKSFGGDASGYHGGVAAGEKANLGEKAIDGNKTLGGK